MTSSVAIMTQKMNLLLLKTEKKENGDRGSGKGGRGLQGGESTLASHQQCESLGT